MLYAYTETESDLLETTPYHMIRIHPSHPSHLNRLPKKSPIVAALIKAYHAHSAHSVCRRPRPCSFPLPSCIPFPRPIRLRRAPSAPASWIRSTMTGTKKYLGSTSGVGTSASAVHAPQPRVHHKVSAWPAGSVSPVH